MTVCRLLLSDCEKLHHDVCVCVCVCVCVYQAENEKDHRVLMGVGNGLRQDVWKEFLRRFGDIRMCEIYGSTEGNLCFMNHIGKIGAVGRSNFFYKVSSTHQQYSLELRPVVEFKGFSKS